MTGKGAVFRYVLVAALPLLVAACITPHAYGQTDERPFVMTWTAKQGETVRIPVDDGDGTYGATGEYTVDWGDGTVETINGTAKHRYSDAGNYSISITGNYTKIYLHGSSPKGLLSIDQWGDVKWTSMAYAFSGARNMVYNTTDVPDLSSVTDTRYMFYFAKKFNGDLPSWNVSGVTDMSHMFYETTAFNGNITTWDVSNVTDMSWMFYESDTFNQDISSWNVSGVTDMSWMFSRAFAFNQDISPWDVSGVKDMSRMFANDIDFNKDISTWNVSGVTDMHHMFYGAYEFNHDISIWDVSGVTDMSHMFQFAYRFNQDISSWNVSGVTDMGNMFRWAERFNGNISSWDVSGVTDMRYMFHIAKKFNGDLSSWNVSGVTDMSNMFDRAYKFNGNISSWDVSGVTDMSSMFDRAYKFNGNISSWDVSGVTDMSNMFDRAYKFNGNISSWDVSRVTDMSEMFSLANAFDQNLGGWYVVPEDTSIEDGDTSLVVTTISAQNTPLNNQNPVYRIGTGHDSSAFEMDHNVLKLKAAPVQSVKSAYTVKVTATGAFGASNHRFINITVVEYVPDTTPPRVSEIWRDSPSGATTNNTILQFGITFSEDVQNVDVTDFVLTGTGTASITNVLGSHDEYDVIVSVTTDGTVTLGLAADNDIEDGKDNGLIDTSASASYTVVTDTTAPTVTSIERHSPITENTGSQTPVYKVTFSESVTGVNAGDFVLSQDSTGTGSIASMAVSDSTYHVTVSAAQDGTYNLDLILTGHGITDAAGNPLADTIPSTGTDHTYTVDTTAPTVASIERHSPITENTGSQTPVYKVTFSESVTGVNAGDFVLSQDSTGTGSIASMAVSDSTYHVTVSAAQDGTYNLDLILTGHGITDAAGNPLADTIPSTGTDHTYTVDTTAPTVASIERHSPITENTGSQTPVYKVTFSEDVAGVNAGDFALSQDSTGAGSITDVTGSGSTYHVTVSALQDGTYNLDLISPGHGITDATDNPLTDTVPTTGTDETYTVSTVPADSTAPTISSIQRYNPAVENTAGPTLIYEVTFSENVTGVDASDFALSSGSTGGVGSVNASNSSGQFTQTRSPTLIIPDMETVSDTITVPDSGTATSVSVSVDITHAWIGDLLVELVAPNGTAITLHDRGGGSADDIDKTYPPDFAGVSIAGNWTLRINDNYDADPGVLNSWTLTVNYDSAATAIVTTTTATVTNISGSGNVYHVTVSALQDGTYSLDLVSSGHSITDAADNPLTDTVPTTGTDETYTVATISTVTTISADSIAPRLASIQRYNPAVENTAGPTLIYEVTFSENVTGVDASDFALSSGSTGGVGSVNASNSSGQFTQTRSPTLIIPDMETVSDTITVPDSGTATSVSVSVDITHAWIGDLLVELVAPNGTAITLHDRGGGSADDIDKTYPPDFAGVSIAGNWTLRINDNYDADPGVLNSWTLTVNYDSAATTIVTTTIVTTTTAPVTNISGSGNVYHVTVSALQDGTYNLDLVSPGHGITDAADNPLTDTVPTTGTDHTYTVTTTPAVTTIPADNTAPTISSIQRYNPAVENTAGPILIYEVTFSENVSGVDASDFALSSGSTAGEGSANINGSSGQFTQTRPSPLVIPDLQTVSDIITIPDSGTATSVSVSVDITHTWIGDLLVDLVAPDGTTVITLHNRTGTSADDIVQTYEPDFGGVSITGNWTLRIDDNYGADPGVLNSWTLTVNYGNAATATTTTATGISGSGDVYYVTVSATQDGTYNLDLVSSGHGIKDAAENPLTDTAPTTGTDHTYTVSTTVADSTAPTLTSIERSNPTTQNTTSQTLVYKATFSESVTGVGTDDFALSSDSTGSTTTTDPVTSISGSGDVYYVTVSASTDGTYNLDLVSSGHGIKDAAENPLTDTAPTTGTDHTYTVSTTVADSTAPTLTSIERSNPTTQNTTSQTLVYKATFSESVTGVGTDDFALSSDSTGSTTTTDPVTSISGSGDVYYVTVSASTDGTYNLDLVSSGHGIKDAAENPLTDTAPTTGTDHTYTVSTTVADSTAPTLTSIERSNPTTQNTTSQTLVYKATFSDVTGVGTDDYSTTTTDPAHPSQVHDVYYVTSASTDTYNLDLSHQATASKMRS